MCIALDFCKGLKDSSISPILSAVHSIYKKIQIDQNKWLSTVSQFSCPSGCGDCCKNFEPDLMQPEAYYLAAWIIKNQPQKAWAIMNGSFVSKVPSESKGCILQDPDNPYHCTVYEGRALICRLFGFAGDKDQHNNPRFRLCKFHPLHKDKTYNISDLEKLSSEKLPIMSDYATEVLALDTDLSGQTEPLREILPKAIQKLYMIIYLNSSSNLNLKPDDSPDNNPDFTPNGAPFSTSA